MLFLGRLNRREELAESLDLPLAELARTPDCNLALAAFAKWGPDCRERLYGHYSLAACDHAERRIVAMRSPECSQHIYLYRDKRRVIVATSTKAIFAFPEIPRRIDELKIADMLVLNHQDFSRSFFEGIAVVGQSQTLVADAEGRIVTSTFDYLDRAKPVRFARDEDYVDRAIELVDRALDRVFRVPGLPATGLSAGRDSTALAVIMIERMRREGIAQPGCLRSYTGIPMEGWDGRVDAHRIGDESGPVRALAAMYPELDTCFVTGEHVSHDRTIDLFQSYADMPVRGVNNLDWGSEIRQRCRKDGHKVIVSGGAGNSTISFAAAHPLFAQWLRQGQWGKLLREARKYVARHPGSSLASILGQAGITNLPDCLYDRYFQWRGHDRTTGYEYFSAINPGFARDVGVERRLAEIGWDDRYRRLPDRQASMRRMLDAGARNDGGGMMEANRVINGVETVSALEDRSLMEFCYAIPDDQFYRGGIDRRLVKRMMRGKLPPEVVHAPRGEQSADWHAKRTRNLARLSEEIERMADIPEIAGRIDIARMRRVIREWPQHTVVSTDRHPDYAIARYGISRALAVARFINQVEGRN